MTTKRTMNSMKLGHLSVTESDTKNRRTNRYTNKLITAYLLGVLSSKASFNHKYKKIFIQFPYTKNHMAYLLKSQFGGSVYEKNNRYTCFELKSRSDLKKLKRVVQHYNATLPSTYLDQLSRFFDFIL